MADPSFVDTSSTVTRVELVRVDGAQALSVAIHAPQETRATAVLVHGGGMSGRVFDGIAAALVDAGVLLIVPDLRSCGRSDRSFADHRIATLADDLREVTEQLADRRATIVGWSLGGAVATEAVARLGDEIAGLVVVGGATPRLTCCDGWDHGQPAGAIDRVGAALDRDREAFYRQLAPSLFHATPAAADLERLLDAWITSGVGADSSYGELEDLDQRDLVASIDVPSLIIHGIHDRFVPHAVGVDLSERIRHARLVSLECGHVPFVEQRSRFLAELVPFLLAA